jgi:hypothetical protein
MGSVGTFSNRPFNGGALVIEVFTDIGHNDELYIYITNLCLDLRLYQYSTLIIYVFSSTKFIFYFLMYNQVFQKNP